jgi:urease accessory protein
LTEGTAEIGFAQNSGVTRLTHLYQRDPLRVMFPAAAAGDPVLAALVTTSGGLVAGDRLDIAVNLEPGATAHITASAAEKVYRSTGPTTTVAQKLSVHAGARLEFLPPETILFDGARFHRQTVVDLEVGAGFLGGDLVVFGRRARGERFTSGLLREVWEVRRDGELVWGDALHLEDNVEHIIDDPACFAGAAAFATLILSPARRKAHSVLDAARAVQRVSASAGLRGELTTVAGLVIARWLAVNTASLRRAYAELASHLRCEVFELPRRLPRLWYV